MNYLGMVSGGLRDVDVCSRGCQGGVAMCGWLDLRLGKEMGVGLMVGRVREVGFGE